MENVRVGASVIVRREGKVLIGIRKSAHGNGTWGFPGGHVEFKEGLLEAALRETREETDLELVNARVMTFTEDIFPEKHYVTFFIVADSTDNRKPQILEPEKLERWEWRAWDDLPEPLFLPIVNLRKTDFNPFEV